MVEVFKTNVAIGSDARKIISDLSHYYPDYKINFDLEDSDKILRIEASNISIEAIITTLRDYGFFCEPLA